MRNTIVFQSNIWATLIMLGFFLFSGLIGSNAQQGLEHLRGKVIVLDPGHGGGDPGTVGVGSTTEAENVLAIAWELKNMLERAGAEVIMTRQTEAATSGNLQLATRVAISNRSRGQIFVSLHNDWHENSNIEGAAVHYYKSQDLALAEILQKHLVRQTKAVDLGVKRNNFYVLRNTNIPAVLVEIGFLSNAKEAKLLAKSSYRLEVALGLLSGINAYFASES